MEINMALLDKMLTQILTETLATAKTQSLRGLILAVAFLGSATASSGEETRAPAQVNRPIPLSTSGQRFLWIAMSRVEYGGQFARDCMDQIQIF